MTDKINEEYVSFETAKLLKEKGFDESCYQKYDNEGYLSFNHVGYINNEKSCDDFYALAPTLQMAMKWLREVHNLHVDSSIYIDIEGDSEHEYTYTYWDWTIFNSESGRIIAEPQIGCGRYDSYEQACEAAIKYCLENLI